eukprot:SAG31_NODE_25767_length_454_cov_1.870423_1_plen_64_part_10
MLTKLQAAGFGFPAPPLKQTVRLADFMMRAVNGSHDLNQPRYLAWMAVTSSYFYSNVYRGRYSV